MKEARLWVIDFVKWYNTEHLHSSIGFVPPEVRHNGGDKDILEKRKRVYLDAYTKNPERWVGKAPRGWHSEPFVTLNPAKKENKKKAA